MEGKVKNFNFRFSGSGLVLIVIACTVILSGCVKRQPSTPLLQPLEWRACPQVQYPARADATKQEGIVHAVMHVDSGGKVTSVDTSGDELFFRETVNALKRCKFPEGTAAQVWRTVTFKLQGGASIEYPSPKEVDDLLGDLSSSEDHNKLNSEVGSYAGEIKTAIESKFYDHVSFNGMTCYVRVNLAPDGLLMVIRAERGDASLCQAALKAASQAHIPAPPNKAIYEVFKNAPLDFKP